MTDDEVLKLGKRRMVEELNLFDWADVVRLLGSATEVYNAHSAQGVEYTQGKDRTWFPSLTHTSTHRALLIGVTPIAGQSREERMAQLLKELIAAQCFTKLNINYIPEDWVERAKQLLNERGEK